MLCWCLKPSLSVSLACFSQSVSPAKNEECSLGSTVSAQAAVCYGPESTALREIWGAIGSSAVVYTFARYIINSYMYA
jgi:hypothetical protein